MRNPSNPGSRIALPAYSFGISTGLPLSFNVT